MSVGLTRVHEFIARRWIRRKKFLRREPSCQDCAWARAVAWDETRPSCLVHNMCGQNRTKRGCIPHKCPHAGHPAGRADLAQSMRCERALWTKSARGRGKAKRPSSGPIAPDEGRFRLTSPNPRFPCKAQRSDRRRPTGLSRFRPVGEASFRLTQAGEGIRTPGPRITSSVLWPTELLRRDGTESRRPEERHGIVELEVSRPADVLDLVVRGQVDAKSGTPTSCVRGGHRRRLES